MANATTADIERVHQRIDAVDEHLDDLKESVADLTAKVKTNIALCEDCRPKVMGNGDSLPTKVSVLETKLKTINDTRKEEKATRWKLVAAVFAGASAVGGMASCVVAYFRGQ
jgi:septation ring formation regulator EzrA